jgi:hypothetical protein
MEDFVQSVVQPSTSGMPSAGDAVNWELAGDTVVLALSRRASDAPQATTATIENGSHQRSIGRLKGDNVAIDHVGIMSDELSCAP